MKREYAQYLLQLELESEEEGKHHLPHFEFITITRPEVQRRVGRGRSSSEFESLWSSALGECVGREALLKDFEHCIEKALGAVTHSYLPFPRPVKLFRILGSTLCDESVPTNHVVNGVQFSAELRHVCDFDKKGKPVPNPTVFA